MAQREQDGGGLPIKSTARDAVIFPAPDLSVSGDTSPHALGRFLFESDWLVCSLGALSSMSFSNVLLLGASLQSIHSRKDHFAPVLTAK